MTVTEPTLLRHPEKAHRPDTPIQRKPEPGQDPELAPVVTQYEMGGVEELGLDEELAEVRGPPETGQMVEEVGHVGRDGAAQRDDPRRLWISAVFAILAFLVRATAIVIPIGSARFAA